MAGTNMVEVTLLGMAVAGIMAGFTQALGKWLFEEYGRRHAAKVVEEVKNSKDQYTQYWKVR